jgi:hypothetical protein
MSDEMNDQVPDEFRTAVSGLTGVQVWMLRGETPQQAWQSARTAVEWKQATAPPVPPPATAAVPTTYGVGQISQETTGYLNPAAQLEAWRQGRLERMGAPAPPPRRTGEQHRNAPP